MVLAPVGDVVVGLVFENANDDATLLISVPPGLSALLAKLNPLVEEVEEFPPLICTGSCCCCTDPGGAEPVPRPIKANSAIVGTFGIGTAGVVTGPNGFLVPVIWGLRGGGEVLFAAEPREVRGVDAGRCSVSRFV